MKRSYTVSITLVIVLIITSFITYPNSLVHGQKIDLYVYLPMVIKNYSPIFKIAFISNRDGNNEIYVINSDGLNEIRLTNNSAVDSDISWSPDGEKIVYYSAQDGNNEIYIINNDGTAQARLTNNSVSDIGPSWSPNGEKIAFISYRDGPKEIYIMNPDGNEISRLTTNGISESYLTWSPDSSQLAFSANGEIYIIDADGTDQTKITYISTGYAYDLDWSPDSAQITFRGELNPSPGIYYQDIFVVNSNGTGLTNLTNSSTFDLDPKWSPTGGKIVYSCGYEICVRNPDGSNLMNLTNNSAHDSNPSWSALGNYIAISSDRDGNSEIYLISSDGLQATRLTNAVGDDWLPACQP